MIVKMYCQKWTRLIFPSREAPSSADISTYSSVWHLWDLLVSDAPNNCWCEGLPTGGPFCISPSRGVASVSDVAVCFDRKHATAFVLLRTPPLFPWHRPYHWLARTSLWLRLSWLFLELPDIIGICCFAVCPPYREFSTFAAAENGFLLLFILLSSPLSTTEIRAACFVA